MNVQGVSTNYNLGQYPVELYEAEKEQTAPVSKETDYGALATVSAASFAMGVGALALAKKGNISEKLARAFAKTNSSKNVNKLDFNVKNATVVKNGQKTTVEITENRFTQDEANKALKDINKALKKKNLSEADKKILNWAKERAEAEKEALKLNKPMDATENVSGLNLKFQEDGKKDKLITQKQAKDVLKNIDKAAKDNNLSETEINILNWAKERAEAEQEALIKMKKA